jgi:hypothetical membrane protein
MDRVRLGAVAGIGGALLFTAGWIVAGFLQPADYSWSSQEISDLGALTAQHAWVWNLADSLSGILILVFAISLFPLVSPTRAGKIGTALIGIVGVGSVLDGLLREDCPLSTSETCQRLQDSGGLSWHHQAHDIESVLVFLAILAAPFAMAKAFKQIDRLRELRPYTFATGIFLVAATVAYAFLYGEAGGGIAQRLLALSFMAWTAVLAIWMLKVGRADDPDQRLPRAAVAG